MTDNPLRPEPRKILELIPQTDMEWTIRIENKAPIRHGQFMELSIPRVGEAPISISGFGPGYADFTVRKVGKVTDELYNMKKGDTLFVRGCYGNGWPFEQFKDKNMVIVAGGTGVSPVKTVISALCDNPAYAKDVYLIIGFKNSKSILFREDLARWAASPKFHVVYTLDSEQYAGWKSGLVTTFISDIPFASFAGSYACIVVGPPVMMKFAGLELLKNGAAEDKIWMSFERKMSCGIGKCGHCRIDETYVCLDGPVFSYTKAKTLID